MTRNQTQRFDRINTSNKFKILILQQISGYIQSNYKKVLPRQNRYLFPQTLPHYFGLMGGTFDGNMNQPSDRNDEANLWTLTKWCNY